MYLGRPCRGSLIPPGEERTCSHGARRVCWASGENGHRAVIVEGDIDDEVDGIRGSRDRREPGGIRAAEHVIVVDIDCMRP